MKIIGVMLFLGISTIESSICYAVGEKTPQKTTTDSAVQKKVKFVWDKIKGTTAKRPKKMDRDSINSYWLDIFLQCNDLFERSLLNQPNLDRKLAFFVNQFGREGPEADIRWIAVYPSATLPLRSRPVSKGSDISVGDTTCRSLQMRLSEYLTRRLIAEPKIRRRYWHVVAWRGAWFIGYPNKTHPFMEPSVVFPLTAGFTYRGITRGPKDEYWWWARNFVLLAHATGRDDLLKNANPAQLHKVAKQWYRWYTKNERFLRPDKKYPRWIYDTGAIFTESFWKNRLPEFDFPKAPFPDWKGFPPPGKGILWD